MTQSYRDPPRSGPPDVEGPNAVGYLALVLAWLVPGLGHILIGQKGRGIVFALTIHLLFAFGMLVGGIRAINPPEQAIWTYTQMLTGWPMLVANHVEHVAAIKQESIERLYRAQRPPLVPDPPRQDEVRTAAQEQQLETELGQRRIDYAQKAFSANPTLTYHPKVQDIGAVYCGIAGMLNLLVMFDILLRITGSTRELPPGKRAAFDSGPSNSPKPAAPKPQPTAGAA